MGGTIRVLHVDDDGDFLDLVASMLEREHDRITVETATTVTDALERLDEVSIDCIVSDYEMPGRDGLEFLDIVREEYPTLPFVLFTARGSETIASDAIAAGVTDYLEKSGGPDQYAVLANRIENAVERRRASQRAATLDRIRNTVRDVNQILVRSRSRSTLEEQVCDAITTNGPYVFAWIGVHDSQTGIVRPRASAGESDGHISVTSVSTDDSPTGEAIERDELVATQSIADDAFEPPLDSAPERGFRSCAAVPLSFEDERYGVLTVYSTEREAFDGTERDLLRELGSDIGHALHRIEQEQRYRRLFEESINAIAVHEMVTDDDGTPIDYVFLDVNGAFEKITGLDREEVLGEHATDVLPDLDPAFIERYGRVALDGEPQQFDRHSRSLDAHYAISAFPLPGNRFVTTFTDVTTLIQRDRDLAETNALLSTLLETLPFGVLVEDPDREIIAANPAFCEVFDFSMPCSDLVGRDCAAAAESVADLFDNSAAFVERIEDLLDRREAVFDERLELTDGRTLSRSYVPLSLPAGDGNLWLYRDVTESIERQQELENRNEQLETVRNQLELALETTKAYTFDWDPHAKDIDRYPTFEDVFGIDSEEVKPVFDAYFEIVEPEHRQRVKTTIKAAIENRASYDLTYPVQPTDEQIWVREQADVISDDGSVRVVGTVTDVTELVAYERELERQNERLDEFAEVIAHDLRNPLNVARGRAELLADDCDSDHTESLLDAVDRMASIIDNTLTLAQEGDSVGDTEQAPIESIATDCWSMIEPTDATLEVEDEFSLSGDSERLKHVFENLFSNAIEHAPSEDDENVTIRVGQIDDEGFYVADDGDGIPASDRDAVFDPEYSTSPEGTGLGLTIVERIAEAHDWDVAVTEGRTGGARFEFTDVEISS